MPETMNFNHILPDRREGCFRAPINIGSAFYAPAALEPAGGFQLNQRGNLALRIAKRELMPILSADRPRTSLRGLLISNH